MDRSRKDVPFQVIKEKKIQVVHVRTRWHKDMNANRVTSELSSARSGLVMRFCSRCLPPLLAAHQPSHRETLLLVNRVVRSKTYIFWLDLLPEPGSCSWNPALCAASQAEGVSSGAQQEHGFPLAPSWWVMDEVAPPSRACEAVTDSPGPWVVGRDTGAAGASGETNVSSRLWRCLGFCPVTVRPQILTAETRGEGWGWYDSETLPDGSLGND